jgi:hypothetical protein
VNEGSKSLESVSVVFRYPQNFFHRRDLDEALSFEVKGPSGLIEPKPSINRDDNFDYSSYRVSSLEPRVGLRISDPFYAAKTQFKEDVPVTTRDKVSLVASVDVAYSINYLITTLAKDIPATNFSIKLALTKASTLEELQEFAVRTIVEPHQKHVRDELGFVRYLGALILRKDAEKVFVSYQEMDENRIGSDGIVSTPKSEALRELEYSLAVWAYLFH